jgi:PAH dioxygenase large subunit
MATIDRERLDSRLSDGVLIEELVDETVPRVSRRIYGDAEIYELEQERIFRRAWCFLAHESEFDKPGDYVARNLAGEPVVLIKGDDGVIRAFLNSCRHRGMRVCRADRDNVRFMRCVYHGWSYDRKGNLASAFAEELYPPGGLDKSQLGLLPVTQLDSYHGFIFGTWDEHAAPLDEFLGNMRFYLDIYVGRTDEGSMVVGAPHVWDVRTNWKFATDNFTGDNMHLYTAHGSTVEMGMLPPDPMSLSYGHMIVAEGGHVMHMVPGPPGGEYFGMPKEMVPEFERNLDAAQLELLKGATFSAGTVYPNLSFLHVMIPSVAGGPPTPFLVFKYWEPTGVTSTRVHSFFMIDRSAPEALVKRSMETYVRTFGPSGIFEQDDMENWEDCTAVNQGKVAQRLDLHHGMGHHFEPVADFPGPGTAYASSYGENNQIAWYGEWRRWMTQVNPLDRGEA